MSIPFDEVKSLTGVVYTEYNSIIMGGGQAKSRLDTIPQAEEDRLRGAIENGLNYLGYCAGAFMAGSYNGWGLKLSPIAIDYPSFYFSGTDLAMSKHDVKGQTRYVLYYGGPDLSGVGEVIATYRNGAASIVQYRYGKGLIVLTGGHPEASQATINALGLSDPDGSDEVLNKSLINAVVTNMEVP